MDRFPSAHLSPQWHARLNLGFARRDEHTILASRRHSGPLRVQKALYPEGGSVCHAIVLHPPAGICGGDELTIAAQLGDGAHALLTTPGAGKWYRSAGPWAGQTLDFEMAPGAALEWLPQESIVFDGARARMETRIRLAKGACYLGWEVLCLGRRAADERFDHGELRLSTRIEQEGRLIWAEQGRIAGGSDLLASPIGLHGLTALPQLLVARYLGHSSEAARAWLTDLWRLLRPAMIAREAQTPRIWNT